MNNNPVMSEAVEALRSITWSDEDSNSDRYYRGFSDGYDLALQRVESEVAPPQVVPADIAGIIDEALSDWMIHAVVDWANSSMSKAVLDDMTALKNKAQAWLDGLAKEGNDGG